MDKIVYNYDESGVYTGQSISRIDPNDINNYLHAANTTEIAPGSFNNQEIPVWNGSSWVNTPDFRGLNVYNKKTMEMFTIINVGLIPNEVTNITPPIVENYTKYPYMKQVFDDESGKWILDPEFLKYIDITERNEQLIASDGKVLRYNSEKTLVDAGVISKTTNSSEEMLQWETYRKQLRDYTIDYIAGKPMPTKPNIA